MLRWARLKDHSIAFVHSLVLALLRSPLEETTSGKIPPWINLLWEVINDRWNETLSLAELSAALAQTATESAKPADRNSVVGVKMLFRNARGEILLWSYETVRTRIYGPSSRQGIASTGFISTRPATTLAPSLHSNRLSAAFPARPTCGACMSRYPLRRRREQVSASCSQGKNLTTAHSPSRRGFSSAII